MQLSLAKMDWNFLAARNLYDDINVCAYVTLT